MNRKVVLACVLFPLVFMPGIMSAQMISEDDGQLTGIYRWSFRTNALDWLLTVPNLGFEYDLSGSAYNRTTLGMSAYYNWDSYHSSLPYNVFNLLKVKPEFRYYWRSTASGRRNARPWRANYVGAYAEGGSYSLKLSEYGHQGYLASLGLTMGYGLPMYEYKSGAVDIELGFSLGVMMVTSDAYRLDSEAGRYVAVPERSRGLHVLPYPVVSELSIAFVWRKSSIRNKYIKVDHSREFRKQARELSDSRGRRRKTDHGENISGPSERLYSQKGKGGRHEL